MKKFEAPKMEVEKLEVMDMITTSGDCEEYDPSCPYDTGREM